ncbi:stigma-specific STIG1 family protein, partial [Tanacetum coccineum]
MGIVFLFESRYGQEFLNDAKREADSERKEIEEEKSEFWGGGVKEKDLNDVNNKASKDGAVPFTTVAYGNTQKENVGQSSTCPTGPTDSESGPYVSFASLLHGESKRKGLKFRTLITQDRNRASVLVPLESIRVVSESSMVGLDSMLKNGPWFIRNNPLILKKWNPDVNLMKEDTVNIPVWVKLHGLPATVFTKDGLSAVATDIGTHLMLDSYTSDMCIQSWGISSYARVLIEIRADVELKDTIVEECPKNLDLGVAKNLKKPSQASRGVPVGPKVGFKPVKKYRPVAKKPTANTSGNKKKGVEPTKEVSNSNPFDVLNLVVNDEELGTDVGGSNLASKEGSSIENSFWNVETSSISTTPIVEKTGKLKQLIIEGKVSLIDDDGKPLKKVDYSGDHDSDDK